MDARLRLRVLAAPGPGGEPILSARLGLVWQRMLPARLVRSGYAGDLEAAPLEPDEFVVVAADAASRRAAEDRLLQSLLKATDGLISRTINRRISLRVTRLLLDTSLTPNQMTLIAALFGVAAIGVVVRGGAAWLVPGAVLLQIQSILDGCDGEISRLKYIRSRLGEWLDQVLDDVVNLGYFAVAGWALYRAGSAIALPVLIVGVAAHLIYQISLYTALLTRGGGSGSVASIQLVLHPQSARGAGPLPLAHPVPDREGIGGAGRPARLLHLPLSPRRHRAPHRDSAHLVHDHLPGERRCDMCRVGRARGTQAGAPGLIRGAGRREETERATR